MNVFNYNTLTKQLEINEPEILLVKEFKALIQRDKSAEKDRAILHLFSYRLEKSVQLVFGT